ncbi:MAG: calcium-binding protein, partial [Pseudomonadota bacterium]
ALGNAVFDAGIATWEAKVFYDYARPVRAVRDLGELGLIGEEGTDYLGNDGIVIDAYAGPGLGTQTILAEEFVTYQTPGADVSPPFAEYTSGHSAFSAAGAAVLQAFTGSDEFGGEITFEAGTSRFEPGETPGEDLTLAWETFSEAADEGGISRLYGGIHFDDGDINGRTLGTEAGAGAYEAADALVTGAVAEVVDIRLRGDGGDSILTAGRGDDRAAGRGGDDVMSGLLGDDVLRGGAGDDELYGGEGDDRLIGGAGDDFLSGGEGDDLYRTGPGADTVLYTAGDDTIRDFRLGGGTRPGDTLIFDLDGEERALSSEADFLEMVALLADDGDAATGALIDGRDLTLVFSGEDTILLDGVVSRRGLDDDALAEAGATLLA